MGGARMIDIAEAVGVSKVTVSKVLSRTAGNNTRVGAETTRRILDAARQMGYHPNIAARQLAGKGSRLIGVLIDAHSIFNEFPRIIYEEQAAGARGYRVIVGQCHADMREIQSYLDDFASRSVDGVVMHAHAYPSLCSKVVKACSGVKNIIYYDKPDMDSPSLNYVDIDLASGMRRLVRHVAASGRRRISYFVPYMKPKMAKYRSFRERERGFREAMEELGLRFDPEFAGRHLFNLEPDPAEIAPLVRRLVKRERPDAIIARNDDVAAIVLKTILEMGVRCPDDIAVAGFDNRDFAQYLHPSLTTVDTNLARASNLAVEKLIGKIEGSGSAEEPCRLVVEPDLVVRESA